MIRITIRKKYFQFLEHNLLVMWSLDDTTASRLIRTFGRTRNTIQRLTSVSCKILYVAVPNGVSLRGCITLIFLLARSALSECHSLLLSLLLSWKKSGINRPTSFSRHMHRNRFIYHLRLTPAHTKHLQKIICQEDYWHRDTCNRSVTIY